MGSIPTKKDLHRKFQSTSVTQRGKEKKYWRFDVLREKHGVKLDECGIHWLCVINAVSTM